MTVGEFLAWTEGHDARYELFDGVPVAMTPERLAHSRIKGRIFMKLVAAIGAAKLRCEALVDGVGVQVDDSTVYIPDVLVFCTPSPPDEARLVPDPIIIVEVLSPSTQIIDTVRKLEGYFRLASLHHYVIVDGAREVLLHHARRADGTILTRIIHNGALSLDPPGIELRDVFAA